MGTDIFLYSLLFLGTLVSEFSWKKRSGRMSAAGEQEMEAQVGCGIGIRARVDRTFHRRFLGSDPRGTVWVLSPHLCSQVPEATAGM
jgi:hypothetical protein